MTAKSLFDGSVPEAVSEQLISASARQIAHLIDTLHMTLDLDQVVLGGSIGLQPTYLSQVKALLISRELIDGPRIEVAECGHLSGVQGAAFIAERQLLMDLAND
ncbi:hypothetical protein GCM10007392_05890 [Saccharospirillum salsuginis]|uniref:ROK family protein n=1 Tax=Saccharospirillum salsuginis TaxID=418750 RepID=A0A918N6V6_9GAMM|nr:hypothetical protein GCM10007392_05890 [Saccharospirillum salsuginis]